MMVKRTFDEWLEAVNEWLEQTIGISLDDLPDYNMYSLYECGESPRRAAGIVLQEAGF